eukprot:TRINITY_DN4590_c0_g1_i1.p1 TRINITY_DN4590_c0_g1~~TRINITY_DN4590_c0_g1_i1.p1  ORF type:complete len:104 (+),score=21.00 TRINITY_DN4590_c0_g1_i1:441-752(+)
MAQRQVLHDCLRRRFYLPLDGGKAALIDYQQISDNVYDFYHTETPSSHRGQGLAAIVAKEAMEHAMKNGWYPILSCWYLQEYRAKNPELDSYLREKEKDTPKK